MTLTITTTITVADDEAYTAREQAILAAIAAHPAGKGIAAPAEALADVQPTPAAATEKIPAGVAADARIAETRAKAKAAAEAKAKAAAEAAAAAEEPAVDNDAEALAAMEADLAGDAPTLEDAVTRATALIGDGKAAQVKAALLGAGVKRVSELKGDGISTFLTALEG